MTSLASEGTTMIAVSHEMGFARNAADRGAFMAGGRIVEDSTPDEFFAQPRSARAQGFLSKIITHRAAGAARQAKAGAKRTCI